MRLRNFQNGRLYKGSGNRFEKINTGMNSQYVTLCLVYLVSSCFLCGYFPIRCGNPGWRKSLYNKLQRIGKLAAQEARGHQANKVKRVLLKINTSIYLLESITWILIQILHNDGHFENYAIARALILSLGCLWKLCRKKAMRSFAQEKKISAGAVNWCPGTR